MKNVLNSFNSQILLALMAIVFIFACTQEATEPNTDYFDLSGTVVDEAGEAIPGATVYGLDEVNKVLDSDTTATDGSFVLENVPEDLKNYYLKVEVDETVMMTSKLSEIYDKEKLQNKSKIKITIQQEDTCCNYYMIKVTDSEGNAVKDADIWARKGMKDTLSRGETDENGNYGYFEICEKTFEVRVAKEGYKVVEKLIENKLNCDTLTYEIKLYEDDEEEDCCDGSIKVWVQDESGEKIKNAEVRLWKDGKKLESGKSTDGYVYFDDLCEGKYEVTIFADNYKEIEFFVELGCNEEKVIEKKLVKKDEDCCDGSIKVWVQDESGEKIKNAEVRLWKDGKKLESGKSTDGYVYFDDLCEGKYVVTILADNYQEMEFAVELGCNEEKVVEKKLVKKDDDGCCNAVIVKVQDEEGNPIKNAEVKLQQYAGEYKKILNTNESGEVSFYSLCNGEYWTRISVEGYKVKEEEFTFDGKCDTLTITQKLIKKDDDCCDGSIKVWVQDESGEKIKNAEVRLWKDGKKLESGKSTDGYVYFDDLCEGKYGVDILADNYKSIEFNVELGCNEEKVIEKKLVKKDDDCCDGSIKVWVQDESGEKIKNAEVRLWKDGKKLESGKSTDGYVYFDDLCEGKYVVTILADNYQEMEFALELGCNEEKVVEKKLVKKDEEPCCDSQLKIFPKDKVTKETITGSTVTIKLDGKVIGEHTLSEKETYAEFEDLCEGKYTVYVKHAEYEPTEFEMKIGCNKELQETAWLQPK